MQRLVARIQALDGPMRDELSHATLGLRATVRALIDAGAQQGRLDASAVRDLTTVHRRLTTILAHVGPHPGPDRLGAEALRVAYARVDLAQVVKRACACFEALAREREIDFVVDVPPELVVELDVAKIRLAICNTLFNAFKYVPRGGSVRCTLTDDELLRDVVFSIEDSGPGVPPTQLDSIFERGREGERSVAIRLGTARLSLGLSRDLVSLHGGVLDAVPTSTGHALFEIRLPLQAPAGATVSDRAPASSDWQVDLAELAASELRAEAELGARRVIDDGRPSVLVIEASRALNRAMVRSLEPAFVTASALGCDEGIELAASLRPDLVIIDLDAPSQRGEDTIRALREHAELSSSLLAITAGHDEPQILRLLEIGVHDIMSKPVLLAEMVARAGRLITTKKTQELLGETVGQRDTDLVALASEVAQAHHDLERAYAELEIARERAERMNEAKSNFLRIMSHELKTPVTAMKLQLNVLENDPEVPRSAVLDRGLERIGRSSRRLIDLVDTMLEWARVEDGRYRPELETFELADLAEEVVARMESQARVRKTELVVEDPRPPLAPLGNDRRLVRLVLINLVERAISVSDGATVVIQLAADSGGQHVLVRDAAPVLSEEQRREVFDPIRCTRDFHRLSGSGSGMGVYAIRDIARAVGGDIRWQDAGGSNAFVFDIPNRASATEQGVVRPGAMRVERARAESLG